MKKKSSVSDKKKKLQERKNKDERDSISSGSAVAIIHKIMPIDSCKAFPVFKKSVITVIPISTGYSSNRSEETFRL